MFRTIQSKDWFLCNFPCLFDLQQAQPEEKFPLSLPEQPSSAPSKPDTSALKDLKADIESAIQDALRNAVSKSAQKAKPSEEVHVDGERAKPQVPAASPEQVGSGSGVQTQNTPHQGSTEDAMTGETHSGSGSGLKPESRWRAKLRGERHLTLFRVWNKDVFKPKIALWFSVKNSLHPELISDISFGVSRFNVSIKSICRWESFERDSLRSSVVIWSIEKSMKCVRKEI